MEKYIWQRIYYLFISPLMIIIAHVFAIFSKTIRHGLLPRYKVISTVQKYINSKPSAQKYILCHAASLGEFEHIKPILHQLHKNYGLYNIVTFFSPSGYNHAEENDTVHLKLYMPFDLPFMWRKIYRLIKPEWIIIAKHDVWPAQIWTAREKQIPIFLVNASLSAKSSRTRWYVKSFLKYVYREFSLISAISQEDSNRFRTYYPRCSVKFIGDTKYDQVVLRKRQAQKRSLLPSNWLNSRWIFIAGSVWPEDTQNLYPVLQKLLAQMPNFTVIIVPHQPEQKIVEHGERIFSQWNTCRFSKISKLREERIIIVDIVGVLASLYYSAHAAYVGGSFKQGIHNVMEPAIYGIPVLFGPIHLNSHEAVKLKESGGGVTIQDDQDFEQNLIRLIRDEDFRVQTGEKALTYALRHTGATKKLIQLWQPLLKRKKF